MSFPLNKIKQNATLKYLLSFQLLETTSTLDLIVK